MILNVIHASFMESYTKGSINITKEDNDLHPEWLSDYGNGIGTVKLYHKGKLIDSIHCENVGCEYGEFDHPEAYQK